MYTRTRAPELARRALQTVAQSGMEMDSEVISLFFHAAERLAPDGAILSVAEEERQDARWEWAIINSVMEERQ